jgi:hypothetical protein
MLYSNSILTKSIVSMLIIGIAMSAAVGIVNVKAPYAKNFEVHLASWDKGILTFTGSVDIHYKNPQAWIDIGYKDGNFQYFYAYWQQQEGKTFSYAGVNVKLIDVSMTLAQHTKSSDHLTFTIMLQQV